MTELTPLEQIQQAKKAFNDAVATHGKNAVQIAVKQLFEKAPEVKAVRWRQYTPYFNDGDACEFSIHEVYYRFTPWTPDADNEDEDDNSDYGDGFVDAWSIGYREKTKELHARIKDHLAEFGRIITGDLSEVVEVAFGDHKMITIGTDQSIVIEDYDHD